MKQTVTLRVWFLMTIFSERSKATLTLSTVPKTAIDGEDFSFICSYGLSITQVEFRKDDNFFFLINGYFTNKTCKIPGNSHNINFEYICNSSSYTVKIPGQFLTEDLHRTKWECLNLINSAETSGKVELYINVPITIVTLSNEPDDENPVNVIKDKTKEFTCSTNAGRPPSRIEWFLEDVNITSSSTNQTTKCDTDCSDDKTKSLSYLIYNGTTNDSGKIISCTAFNIEGYDVRSINKTIDILYSPTTPFITQSSLSPVYENETITLTCEIKGGNPLAKIIWQCNGSTPVNSTDDPISNITSISTVQLIATKDKNGKSCKCVGKHPAWTQPNSTILVLDILYAPASPSIMQTPRGPIFEGTEVLLNCEISGGNPVANISWMCEGFSNITPTTIHSTDRVVSSIVINVTRANDGKVCSCRGHHPVWTEITEDRHTLIVYFPPERSPSITPTVLGPIDEDTKISLTCEIQGGKPLAVITWHCNGSSLVIPTVSPPMGTSFSNIQLTVTKDHNGEECKCIGSHPAWTQNKSSSIHFDVKYPPELFLPIQQTPKGPIIEDRMVRLTCEIAGGNPLASIDWRCDGFTPVVPINILHTDKVVSIIEKNVTKDDNGKHCICTGQHRLWTPDEQTRNHSLNVYYSSTINISNNHQIEVVENRTMVLVCKEVDGNPRNASFSWYQSNILIGNSSNYSIMITKVKDAGNYTCKGSNGFGKESKATIEVHILYSPRISAVSALYGSTISENSTAVLQCIVQSNPSPNMVWLKRGSNSILQSTENLFKSNLTIKDANCFDTSNYTCKAMNIITNTEYTTTKDIELFVNCSPRRYDQHDGSPQLLGLAVGQNLNISDHILAYPKFNITWFFKRDQNTTKTITLSDLDCSTYNISDHRICFSKLNLTEHDFGIYSAVITNDLGNATLTYIVNPQEKPYKSTNLNATCGILKAEISWRTGYNGGQQQKFYIIATDKDGLQRIYNTEKVGNEKGQIILHSIEMPPGPFIFDVFGNNTFGNATVKGASCEIKGLEEKSSVIGLAAGLGSGIAVLLIVIVAVVLIYRKRVSKKYEDDAKLCTRSEKKKREDDQDELQDNPLYVTSDLTSSGENGPVYSIVDKTNKPGFKKTVNVRVGQQGPVYSDVQKVGKKEKHNKEIEMGNVYGNAERILQKNNEECVYANAESKLNGKNSVGRIYRQKKNKDGLIYADLELDPTPSGKKFVIRGIENRTNYAIIDLNVKVDPLPSDDDDNDNEDLDKTQAKDPNDKERFE